MPALSQRHLLGIEPLLPGDIRTIVETAKSMKSISKRAIKKVPALRGKTIVNLFLEPSTRTRSSFEIAAKRLSADTLTLSGTGTSLSKGETLMDTARNLEAMAPDAIVIRHSASGAPHMLARILEPPVINAGDGSHEHPTQALLDLMTVEERKGPVKGFKVAIVGDIAHSRVARSNIFTLTKMGALVWLCGPATMIPREVEQLGARVTNSMDEALEGADVVMMLRIQLERGSGSLFPSVPEYAATYGLNRARLKRAKRDVVVLHPGPINRGIEIASDVADGEFSVILDQVENGVAVRMALLYLLITRPEGRGGTA
ncbi:MAG: aspartate carbamoyltransferase catalytic subunit [Nitrospirae bacterium]|nr:aspartate carbamoyltransferase catalytic subunit [Nitrospirota bacterium]MBI4241508.1 aspartate carbamoyltransferase catalytic subunit [Candidatus Rokubacteria bacterium]